MNEIPIDDAFLQVNDDQCGAGVKSSKRHRVLLLEYEVGEYEVGMRKTQDTVGSILNQPRKQFECSLKLLLLLSRKLLRDGHGEPVLSRIGRASCRERV